LEPPEEACKTALRWASAWSTLSESDLYLGKMKTMIARREKLVELLFPQNGFMIIVSVHPAFPFDKISKLEKQLSELYVGGDEWRQTWKNEIP